MGISTFARDITEKKERENELIEKHEELLAVYEELTAQFRISGQVKGIDIIYYIDPDIDENLLGDSVRLIQILNNILNNALKFKDRGYIILTAKHVSTGNGRVKILFSVQDSGIGISDEIKERIFDSFVQGIFPMQKNIRVQVLDLPYLKNLSA